MRYQILLLMHAAFDAGVVADQQYHRYSDIHAHVSQITDPVHEAEREFLPFFLVLVQVPRVFIGEECIGGGSDVAALQRSGKLEGKLKSIGALQ